MPGPAAPRFGNPGFDAFPQNVALKLRKDRQQPGHGAPKRRGEIQGFAEGDKAHPQRLQLMQRAYEICDRPAPAI
jgi:hypothetical protein